MHAINTTNWGVICIGENKTPIWFLFNFYSKVTAPQICVCGGFSPSSCFYLKLGQEYTLNKSAKMNTRSKMVAHKNT